MRAVRFHEYGGPDVLLVDDVPRPEARFDEVVVEVHAIGGQSTDTHEREESTRQPQLPQSPGSDFTGVVVEVGEDITDYSRGDRVVGTGVMTERQGSYAEYVAARAKKFPPVQMPEDTQREQGQGRIVHLPDDDVQYALWRVQG